MIAHLTKDEILLLKSALLQGHAARLAYQAWRPTFDFEATEYGHQRILPLLQKNLTELGIDDPLMPRLRGIRHYFWARNQIRLHAVAPVLAALRAAGIPCMVLKGAALLASCLDDAGLRPMDDLDLLIPKNSVGAAVDILAEHGFLPVSIPPWAIATVVADRLTGMGFVDRSGQQIDLHWNMFALDRRPNADDAVWSSSRPAEVSGVELSAPGFVHQVLHTLAHATEWNVVSPLRWAPDAMMILRTAGLDFDWDGLVAESISRRLAFPLHDRLAMLAREMEVPVPAAVLDALKRDSRGFATIEFASRAIPHHERSALRRVLVDVLDFRRERADLMQRSVLASVWPFVASRLNARGLLRQLCVIIFALLDRPGWLRRLLRIDTAIRRIDPGSLPSHSQVIDIRKGPEGYSALVDGWSIPETTGCWTLGMVARLAWRLPPQMKSRLRCHIDADMFMPPQTRAPAIELWVNDRLVHDWDRDGHPADGMMSFDIPASAIANSEILVVTFVVRGALSPADVGISTDTRKLGLHLRRIAIAPVEDPVTGTLREAQTKPHSNVRM